VTLTKRTDRDDRALGKLPQQFKTKAGLQSMVSITSTESQEIEGALFEIRDDCTIDAGSGVQLDGEGEVVVQNRISADDEEYRDALRVKVAINTAEGDADRLTQVAQAISGADIVHYRRFGLAHCSICCINHTRSTELARLEKVAPAGVSLEVNAGATAIPFTLGRAVDAAGVVNSVYDEDYVVGEGFGTVDPATGDALDGGEMVATYVGAGT
jgi:hypothetical protein